MKKGLFKRIEQGRDKNDVISVLLIKIKDILFAFYDNFDNIFCGIKISKLKNKYQGKRCFIVGNGPSLKINDLNKLKNEITFGSNGIFLASRISDFKPTYYVVLDTHYLENHINEIMKTNSIKVFNSSGKILFSKRERKNIFWFRERFHDDHYKATRKFSFNLPLGIYSGSTVIYAQIQLAVYMGFKDVYLIGLDHDYSFDNQHKKINEELFIPYKENNNYFHKDYFVEGKTYNLPRIEDHHKSHVYAKKVCDKLGVKVYNASRKTKLDVYPRVSFDSIF